MQFVLTEDSVVDDSIENKVEIFSTEDERIKFLGELLSNESSRRIFTLLIKHDMAANEISEKTDLRLSLVIHHLNKMQNADIVEISKIVTNSKGHDMKFYKSKSAILILPREVSEKAMASKSLSLSLKRILKFSAIGTAGLVSWFITRTEIMFENGWRSGEESSISNSSDTMTSFIIGLSVILIGLIIERIHTHYKK